MKTKLTKFILAIIIQVVIIFAIIIFKLLVLSGGTDVLLRIEPVDPRDPLRGDYATFQYNISNIDSYILGNEKVNNGQTIYLVLGQNNKYWVVKKIQKSKPINEEVFMKGKVASGSNDTERSNSPLNTSSTQIHVVYGIEEFFIPEGKGRGFDFSNKEASARVAIDKNGNSVLKQIFVDDKPWP